MKISIPATSANLGPGFDSCGIALNRYLTIEIHEVMDHWYIEHDLGLEIPTDKENLLLQTALSIVPNLIPHRVTMSSTIPLARGLGSSSSVIVAGIELANQLGELSLTAKEKLALATKIEGHPDNVAPAIYGQLAIASYDEPTGEVAAVTAHFPECAILAYIPNSKLLTKTSRGVLPKEFSYQEAVQASSIANVMIGALMTGDIALAANMMAKDRFHEPFRQALVPELGILKEVAKQHGAYGAFLSGAGPTVLFLAPPEKGTALKAALMQQAGEHAVLEELAIDTQGIHVSL